MSKTRRQSKEEKLLAQFAAMVGKDVSELKAAKAEEYPLGTPSMQKEAALDYIRRPQGYVAKKCRECGEPFGTNYRHVSYCSDRCREKSWVADTKIPWNMNGKTQQELWGGEVPVIIKPDTWKRIEFMVEQIQELRESGNLQVQEPDQEDSLVHLESEEEMILPPVWDEEWSEESFSAADTSPPSSPSSSDDFGFGEISSFSLQD